MGPLLVLSVLALFGDLSPVRPPTTPAAESAVRAADRAYVDAWLKNDQQAVLATLANDAVLMPAGQYPLRSRAEIMAFWWPDDRSTTRIVGFDRVIDELEVQQDMAMVRGTDLVTFEYAKGATRTKQTNRSMTLAIYRRQADGSWRISRMMWGTRSR